MTGIVPTQIALHTKSALLEISFSDQSHYELGCEYLRVFSPSADARMARSQGNLISGKEDVSICQIEPIGQYAVRLVFDDGHHSGIYSWQILKDLADNYEANWADYQWQKSHRL